MEMLQTSHTAQTTGGGEPPVDATELLNAQEQCRRLADAADQVIEQSLSGVNINEFLRSTQQRGAQ